MRGLTRRVLLHMATAMALSLSPLLRVLRAAESESAVTDTPEVPSPPLGVDGDGYSHVFCAKNGSPGKNMAAIIDMLGGIDSLIGPRDIVVIKPNAQWWNQGMTNTDAISAFINLVLDKVDFSGEVIIADNHQFAEDNSRGWTTEERNGTFNYNELIEYFQGKGHVNVTKSHWHVAGKTNLPLEGNAQGNHRIKGPEDGDGYVWLEDLAYRSANGRRCVMTYPVFTSSFSGITIDLHKGAWKNGSYLTDRNVRFINFSALNHHGSYCGVTASVKNLMGVVDMSCGFPGDTPQGTYNTHHIGVSKIIRWKKNSLFMRLISRFGFREAFFEHCYKGFHHTGGSLGFFMRNVRLPDLNIITAERVGWGSRVDLNKSFQARTLLASRDPVALDYIAARDVLLAATPPGRVLNGDRPYHALNNPDNRDGPFYRFLNETAKQGIGNLDSAKIQTHFKDLAGS